MLSNYCSFNIPVFNRRVTAVLTLLSCCALYSTPAISDEINATEQLQPKRIEVYSLSQHYWDVQFGDTLGEIAHHLLPHNPVKRQTLQQDILHLNPGAFIAGNPARLIAGKRLWLPGHMRQADSKPNPATTTVETYSWGNIKRKK